MTVFFYICDYLNVTPKEFFDESIVCPEQFKNLYQDMQELDRDDLQLLWTLTKTSAKIRRRKAVGCSKIRCSPRLF